MNHIGGLDASKVSHEDEQKLRFINSIRAQKCPGLAEDPINYYNEQAVKWRAERTSEQARSERFKIVGQIEALAATYVSDGSIEEWFERADSETRKVAEHVNGPAMAALARVTKFPDAASIDQFRDGGFIYDYVGYTGCGPIKTDDGTGRMNNMDELRKETLKRNRKLIRKLKPNELAGELCEKTDEDVTLHRMTPLVDVEEVDLKNILVSQRFGVKQGCQPDGSVKVRPVDDASASGINGCYAYANQLKTEGIDCLFTIAKLFIFLMGICPGIWKADVNAAFRRVPLAAHQRWAAHVAFKKQDRVVVSGHLAMPFGATGSVLAWDRIGEFIVHLLRVLLHIPCLRWVDDFYCVDHPDDLEYIVECFQRVVRCLLGPSSVPMEKCSFGQALTVLGVSVSCVAEGFSAWPSIDKVTKWLAVIDKALSELVLAPGLCGKLVGALNWAAQHIFHRIGRAMLRPLYNHAHGRKAKLDDCGLLALRWWRHILSLEIKEHRSWFVGPTESVIMLADACGKSKRIAAVLITSQGIFYTDMVPSNELLAAFRARCDNQIMGLEMLAIGLGFCAFAHLIQGKHVRLYSDNTGAEAAVKRGTAKSFDHALLAQCIWTKAATLKSSIFVERVPTAENLADLPSRGSYELLHRIGARFVQPTIDEYFFEPDAWLSQSLCGQT